MPASRIKKSFHAKDWKYPPEYIQDNPTLAALASDEHLFHRLAYDETLAAGSIVDILNPVDHQLEKHETVSILNQSGFVCTAFKPVNLDQDPITLKICFRGTHDFGSALIDTERYSAGYESYKKHESALLSKIDSLIKKTYQDAIKSGNPAPKINLHLGGHSLGGSLAQYLAHSLTKQQLKFALQAQSIQLPDPAFKRIVQDTIQSQASFEINQKNHSKTSQNLSKKINQKKQNYLKQFNKQTVFTPADSEYKKYSQLKKINHIQCSFLNSAGIAQKTREAFAINTSLLHQLKPGRQIMACRYMMVGGDVVQQTGQTNLAAYLPPGHLEVELIKIDAGYENLTKHTTRFMLEKFSILAYMNLIGLVTCFNLTPDSQPRINPIDFFEIPEKLSTLFQAIKQAHTTSFFNHTKFPRPPKYDYFSNQEPKHQAIIEKNLTHKIPIVHEKFYQAVKNIFKPLRDFYAWLTQHLKTPITSHTMQAKIEACKQDLDPQAIKKLLRLTPPPLKPAHKFA